MAVVTKYASGYPDPASYTQPSMLYRGGAVRQVNGAFTIANGDSAGSKLYLSKVPADGVPLPGGLVSHGAITGLTDLDIGFANDPDALADGLTVAAAGTKSPIAAVPVASLGKPFWQLAGYASNPGGELDIILTMNAGATAAGDLHVFLPYVSRQ